MKPIHLLVIIFFIIVIFFFFKSEEFAPLNSLYLESIESATGLPRDVANMIRSYNLSDEVINLINQKKEETVSGLTRLFRDNARSLMRSNLDIIINGDSAPYIYSTGDLQDWVENNIINWINPDIKTVNQNTIVNLIQTIQSPSTEPIITIFGIQRPPAIDNDQEVNSVLQRFAWQSVKDDKEVLYAKIITNLEKLVSAIQNKSEYSDLKEQAILFTTILQNLDSRQDNTNAESQIAQELRSAIKRIPGISFGGFGQ